MRKIKLTPCQSFQFCKETYPNSTMCPRVKENEDKGENCTNEKDKDMKSSNVPSTSSYPSHMILSHPLHNGYILSLGAHD